MEAMGGTLTAEETPGGGLTLVIDLPAAAVDDGVECRAPRSTTRVLVVDDDPAIVRTLAINLRARDYQVQVAHDGRTALQILTEEPPDVMLLDLGLPDLDGVSVLRRLRAFSALPVIVLSARHSSDDKVEALDLGADDYVTKPFGVEELMARIRAALRQAPAESGTERRVVTTPTLRLDLGEHLAQLNGVAGAPDPDRVADGGHADPPARGPGPAGRSAPRGVGSELRQGEQLPPGLHGAAAAQARGRAQPAAALPDRARGRAPVRALRAVVPASSGVRPDRVG